MLILFIIFVILVLVTIILIVQWVLYRKAVNRIELRGLNGSGTIKLECPSGKTIIINTATLICAQSGSFYDSSCNPANTEDGRTSDFNPQTTIDVTKVLQDQFNGTTGGELDVGSLVDTSTICSGSACDGNIAIVGSYYCVPPGAKLSAS
jgi:hypothetical protein